MYIKFRAGQQWVYSREYVEHRAGETLAITVTCRSFSIQRTKPSFAHRRFCTVTRFLRFPGFVSFPYFYLNNLSPSPLCPYPASFDSAPAMSPPWGTCPERELWGLRSAPSPRLHPQPEAAEHSPVVTLGGAEFSFDLLSQMGPPRFPGSACGLLCDSPCPRSTGPPCLHSASRC